MDFLMLSPPWINFISFLVQCRTKWASWKQYGKRESNICLKALVVLHVPNVPISRAFSPSWGNMKDRRILTLLGYGISPYKKNSEDWKINSPSYKRFWINLQLGDSWIKEWMQSYGTVPNCSPKKPYLCMFLQTMNEAVHILNGPNCINTFSIIVFQ